jgi:hypothetical protein
MLDTHQPTSSTERPPSLKQLFWSRESYESKVVRQGGSRSNIMWLLGTGKLITIYFEVMGLWTLSTVRRAKY